VKTQASFLSDFWWWSTLKLQEANLRNQVTSGQIKSLIKKNLSVPRSSVQK